MKIPNTVEHNGKKLVCKCFDNGDKSFDRYTIVFKSIRDKRTGILWQPYIGSSESPFHPQGFGQHGMSQENICGKHLGKRIALENLPNDVQKFVRQELGAKK